MGLFGRLAVYYDVRQRTGQWATPYERATVGPRSTDNGQWPAVNEWRQRALADESSDVTTGQATSEATSNGAAQRATAQRATAQRATAQRVTAQRAAASKHRATSGASNKPMVPTAANHPEERALGLLRRHIGEPLGSQRGGEQWAAKEQALARGQLLIRVGVLAIGGGV